MNPRVDQYQTIHYNIKSKTASYDCVISLLAVVTLYMYHWKGQNFLFVDLQDYFSDLGSGGGGGGRRGGG